MPSTFEKKLYEVIQKQRKYEETKKQLKDKEKEKKHQDEKKKSNDTLNFLYHVSPNNIKLVYKYRQRYLTSNDNDTIKSYFLRQHKISLY